MKTKEKFIVMDMDNIPMFNVTKKTTEKGVKITLSEITTNEDNKLTLSLFDDGNGITFDREIKSMDYFEMSALRTILNIEQETDVSEINRIKYRVLKIENEFKA